MFFKDSTEEFTINPSNPGVIAVIVSGLLVIFFGVLPGTLLDLITKFLGY
jgi:NADH:ubiquinone oxidoreductase subunit 2 (subunit N)